MIDDLRFYRLMAKHNRFGYAAKIVVPMVIITCVPMTLLLAIASLRPAVGSIGLPTLIVGAGITAFAATIVMMVVLTQLLRPVILTSQTLREYRVSRSTGHLPTHFTDVVGTLMADVTGTLLYLEEARQTLQRTDELTGLPNRRQLVRDLKQHKLLEGRVLLCAVRLENYQDVAETLDLQSAEVVVLRVRDHLQKSLMLLQLYRINNSDFVVLRPVSVADDVESDFGVPLMSILADCAEVVEFPKATVRPNLLAGIAIYPDDAIDPDTLIDSALSAASASSYDSQISFHTPDLHRAAVERLQFGQELRQALENDEFVLHYQPVIDVARGEVTGAEALIRWNHPTHGLLPPARFIQEAEKSGAIDAIGLWVMQEACRQVRAWDELGLSRLKVAINLSARQFFDMNLIGSVDEALLAAGITPDRLEIELTETATMADEAYTRSALDKLKELGVSVAIDDFGTGYASISCLRKLPFDKLKIDREFVTDVHLKPDSQAICSAMIALGKGLGLRVLAEGTETAEEVAFMHRLGCDLFQGYHFSKAVPAATFASEIVNWTAQAALKKRTLGGATALPNTRGKRARMLDLFRRRKTSSLVMAGGLPTHPPSSQP